MSEERLNEIKDSVNFQKEILLAYNMNRLLTIYVDKKQELIKEINRLNNIINELEKYCNEEIIDYDKAIDSKILSEIDRDRYEAEKVCFLDMLDKLKASKENK